MMKIENKLKEYAANRMIYKHIIDVLKQDSMDLLNNKTTINDKFTKVMYMDIQANYLSKLIKYFICFFEGYSSKNACNYNMFYLDKNCAKQIEENQNIWQERIKPKLLNLYQKISGETLSKENEPLTISKSEIDIYEGLGSFGEYGVSYYVLQFINDLIWLLDFSLIGIGAKEYTHNGINYDGYEYIAISNNSNNEAIKLTSSYFDSLLLDKKYRTDKIRYYQENSKKLHDIDKKIIDYLRTMTEDLNTRIKVEEDEVLTQYFENMIQKMLVKDNKQINDLKDNDVIKYPIAIPTEFYYENIPYKTYLVKALDNLKDILNSMQLALYKEPKYCQLKDDHIGLYLKLIKTPKSKIRIKKQ